MRLPVVQLSLRLLWQTITSLGCVSPVQAIFCSLILLAFAKAKIAIERKEICECECHTVHKVSQRRLTADWLAPRKSDCSRMRNKVSFDWLPRYIKFTRPVLEIFKMDRYVPDVPRIYITFIYSIPLLNVFLRHNMLFLYTNKNILLINCIILNVFNGPNEHLEVFECPVAV
jgi:hypothetical protein